jgi:tetratricopeptide (TPR) repeat protein
MAHARRYINNIKRKRIFAAFRLSICLLAIFAVAPFVSPAFAAEDETVSVQSLLESGKPEEAYRLSLSAFRESPDDDGVNLWLARSALASGHPHQAIMAYERLLAKYPSQAEIRREIGQVYMTIGDAATAQMYLDGLSGTYPGGGSGQTGSYGRFRRAAKLRFGAFYDSNVNSGLESNGVRIGNWDVSLRDAEKIPSGGLYLGGNLDVSYRASEDGPWHYVGDMAFNTRYGFDGDLRKIDRTFSQWYRAAAGMRYLSGKNMFEARIKFEILDYDFYQTVYSYGLEAAFAHTVSPRFQLITRVGLDDRRYVRDMVSTGYYWSAGQYARWFFGSSGHEFTIGARYSGGNTRRDLTSYDSWGASAAFLFKLPDGYEIAASVSYAEEQYDGPATMLEAANRRDEILRAGLSATKRINERLSLEAVYSYTDNSSNSAIHDYDRHMTSLGLVWTF